MVIYYIVFSAFLQILSLELKSTFLKRKSHKNKRKTEEIIVMQNSVASFSPSFLLQLSPLFTLWFMKVFYILFKKQGRDLKKCDSSCSHL